ncbi:uncharacterized protein LAESUDRAFT_561497 [Laetiporus sulphureus 93-53]|uniref:Uncharacterized protein n=1 Tax=Laetiporus sulphureus 93-53 TaxID=1314785 RepID=A0A165B506_9APHY|nr:uncharacterized protein LAESUDRAFT_561497 [Laetiporus sulphureus 93-53]KZT00251.1 hypothetical protein LAESUDRAFT_561497 [Laetiporus sulphureus 93-53]
MNVLLGLPYLATSLFSAIFGIIQLSVYGSLFVVNSTRKSIRRRNECSALMPVNRVHALGIAGLRDDSGRTSCSRSRATVVFCWT